MAKERISLRLDDILVKELKFKAGQEGRSLNNYIEVSLEKVVAEIAGNGK